MKIGLALIVILSITSSALAEKPLLNLAAIVPLTGNAADQGEWARRGFEIAKEELEAAPLGQVRLTYEDSKGGDPATAVQAYKSLISRGKPIAVITYGSGVGMALSPLVNSDHIIQMGIATATPKYTSLGDFTFRNFPSATLESDFLSNSLVEKMDIRELSIIHINNDYGVGTAGALKAAFERHGGTVVSQESFDSGTTDFRPILLKLKQHGCKMLYLAVYPTDGALLLKQMKELGIGCQVIASVAAIGGTDFFSIAGDSAEGILVSSSIVDTKHRFLGHYLSKYPGESPAQMIYAARAYDAVELIHLAASRCTTVDPACIRDQLFKIREYPGASGTISFDASGDIKTDFALFRVVGREFRMVSSVEGSQTH